MGKITTHDFEYLHVAAQRAIPKRMRDAGFGGHWQARAFERHEMDALVVQMSGYLASDHITTVRIAYPRDWWEAVKERWAPAWALRRWPVRMREHVVDLKAAYPTFQCPETMGPMIRIQTYRQRDEVQH